MHNINTILPFFIIGFIIYILLQYFSTATTIVIVAVVFYAINKIFYNNTQIIRDST